MNDRLAKEWMKKAWHNLSTAQLLYDAHHYTDIIAVELHYAIEKSMKSFLAYESKKIPKTHDLIALYRINRSLLEFDEAEVELLIIATEYHIREAYPQFERSLPSREEIKEVLDFTEKFFDEVLITLNIKKADILS
jgi:HEPN domain-containing protein